MSMSTQFVIQTHSGYGPVHYDMMLASGDALATWQFDGQPTEATLTRPLTCKRIADHRQEYLSYEGPISEGRGRVEIFDRGEYRVISADETRWEFVLCGRKIAGRFELAGPGESSDSWTFRCLD